MTTMKKTEKLSKSEQGKKSRAAGSRFELKVRKDLEDKGWIVSKWMNNVKLETLKINDKIINMFNGVHELVPAKHKFRGPGIPMAIGTGFPDFIAFKIKDIEKPEDGWEDNTIQPLSSKSFLTFNSNLLPAARLFLPCSDLLSFFVFFMVVIFIWAFFTRKFLPVFDY